MRRTLTSSRRRPRPESRRPDAVDGAPRAASTNSVLLAIVDRLESRSPGWRWRLGRRIRSSRPINSRRRGATKRPAAHVLGLFLRPDPLGRLSIAAQGGGQGLGRPGVELLQADDGDFVGVGRVGPGLGQVVIDATAAQDDAADVLGSDLVVDHLAEPARGQLGQGRRGGLGAEVTLGRHQDQGLAEVSLDLTPQHVEILRGRRGLTTWIFSSAQRAKKRSRRALECSGPWPS